MRIITVRGPAGKGPELVAIAHRAGIEKVPVRQERVYRAGRSDELNDVVEVATSTPAAKAFVEAVMVAPFFDPHAYSIDIRGLMAIASHEKPSEVTWPIVIPTVDILEDLWQFTHITASFLVRVLIASALLGYGMIHSNLLVMIAGLLFMPMLPLLLAMAFGARTRDWSIAGHGAAAFGTAMAVAIIGGAAAALVTTGEVRFQEFSSPVVSFVISLGVGIAAGVATTDDAGRRELIGLAATAQTALVPVWVGIALVRGFASTVQKTAPPERLLAFALSVVAIVVAAAVTYALLGMHSHAAPYSSARPES